ncbi:hypothetical protein L6452_29171 [Arctium lappa]|uniref:Uncharacterized protein n=1 Tax=Arctium lappa TaxID=4217 RepID=A0ACB8ZGE1_ARCLA|nr:hypothetical protein L6452_29171 [Arctium lappa]
MGEPVKTVYYLKLGFLKSNEPLFLSLLIFSNNNHRPVTLLIGTTTTADPLPPSPFTVLPSDPGQLLLLFFLYQKDMPKVKTNRVKYPEGWELIEPTLRELQGKMREAENDPHDGKRKCETMWPIFKIAHQKSRYIFDLYHRRKEISNELYEFCLDQGYADRNIIAKWKKPGYERLCCLRCIQPRDHNFQTTCVCRVPKHLREEKVIECVHCGCKGCASGD